VSETSGAPTPPRFEDPAGGFFARQTRRRFGLELAAILLLLGGLVAGAAAAVGPLTGAIVDALPVAVDRQLGALAAKGFADPATVTAEEQARADRILAELVGALDEEERAAIGTPTLTLQDDEAVNAFALPGGALFVNVGLLRKAEVDDDALRGVLAHELGHVRHRHGMRQLVRSQLFGLALAWLFGSLENLEALLVDQSAALLSLAYSRAMEEESDDFAIALARREGWSVEGLARFFEALPSFGPAAFSTHPDSAARAERLRRALAPGGAETR
jgi:predicted Zn-dependent protease